MRNNPSNPSTVDPYDKLSATEKVLEPAEPTFIAPPLDRESRILPVTPGVLLKPAQNNVVDDMKNTVRRARNHSFRLLPTLSLGSDSLSDNLPLSALPEGYLSLPPHPSLPTTQPS
jgi:hypothetical protein